MRTRAKAGIAVGVAAVAVFGAGAAAYLLTPLDSCWTESCRAAQAQRKEAAFAAAETKARADWGRITSLVSQQADIGRAIIAASRETLNAANANSDAEINRIGFVTSGINPLSDIARPYVEQASRLGAARGERQMAFDNGTGPIDHAVATVQLSNRRDLPLADPAATSDFANNVLDLRRSSLAGLTLLHERELIGAARANEFSHAIQASAAALQLAVAAYDQDVRSLAKLDPDRSSHVQGLPIGFNAVQEKQLGLPVKDRNIAFSDPQPVRSLALPPAPRNLAEQRARLSMEQDIEAMDAQSEALRRQGEAILRAGAAYPPSMQNTM